MHLKEKSLWYPFALSWVLPSPTLERRVWPLILGLGYVLAIWFLGGLRPDHVFIGALALLDSYNERTRRFLTEFFPFILTGVVFDSMRYFYWQGVRGHIHVAAPYLWEKEAFGINTVDGRLTLNEFFARHHWVFADLLCGFAYLFFVSEYLLTGFYLFFTDQIRLLRVFAWCFFAVNLLGFITYFVFPVAPPWYVSQYGLGPAVLSVHPSAAAGVRFDQLLGTHFFTQMYGRGIDVFGAYPSLHVSYPLLVLWVSVRVRKFRIPALLFYFLMCFSAIYLQHHYLIDVLMGSGYAILTLLVFRSLFLRDAAIATAAPLLEGQTTLC